MQKTPNLKIDFNTLNEAKEQLKDVRLSHNEPWQIKEGSQFGMWERELTNYTGNGPIIKVYGATPAIAEAMAILVVAAISSKRAELKVGGIEIVD
jgi:hypothetical protein